MDSAPSLIFRDYLTRQPIDIHTSRAQNCDPMVTVEDGSVGSRFKRVFVPNLQGKLQLVSGKAGEVIQLGLEERGFRMQRLQGRIGRHLLLPSTLRLLATETSSSRFSRPNSPAPAPRLRAAPLPRLER